MKQIIRSNVFTLDQNEFISQLRNLSFCPNIHIDFMDGKFTENRTPRLYEMDAIKNYPKINFELHFMGFYPEIYADEIKELGIKKVLIHTEVFEFDKEIKKSIETLKENNIEVGLVLNPNTPTSKIKPFINDIYCVMLMSVFPGRQGQEFNQNTFEKIKELKELYPNLEIQIDGGIKLENIEEILKTEISSANIGSGISGKENPENEYKKFVKMTN